MFTLSAFADEISPDPREQIAVLKAANVRRIEFRSIHGTNVLKLSNEQIREFKAMLDSEGIRLSAIGSPIGKYAVDQPFEPHLEAFNQAIELAHTFGTPNIRVFSFYPPEGNFDGDWAPHRGSVIDRMNTLAERAQQSGVMLLHENEHRIYGDSPERVLDLATSIRNPHFRLVYDAANYVVCGYDPKAAWEATRDDTVHFHIKDWTTGEKFGRLPGHGDGQIPCSIYDAVKREYSGFATLEPHLRGGGPTGGVTGPDLFPIAVESFRQILRLCNGREAFD